MKCWVLEYCTSRNIRHCWSLISSFSSKELLDKFRCRTNVDLSRFSIYSYDPWTKFTTGRTPFLWSWTRSLTDDMFCLCSSYWYTAAVMLLGWKVIHHSLVLRSVYSCKAVLESGTHQPGRGQSGVDVSIHLDLYLPEPVFGTFGWQARWQEYIPPRSVQFQSGFATAELPIT